MKRYAVVRLSVDRSLVSEDAVDIYRPIFKFPDTNGQAVSGKFLAELSDRIGCGENVRCALEFIVNDDYVFPSIEFLISEGKRIVGHGVLDHQ